VPAVADFFPGSFFSDTTLVPLALALIAILFLMSSLRRRLREGQNRPEHESAQRPPPRGTSKDHLRRDLESLIVELQELSRRISAEIDTRFAKLEAAMRDADHRIAVLHRLAREGADRQADASGRPDDHEARHAVVYELADAGMSPVDIAKEVGRTPGEVEVILNLRRGHERTERPGEGKKDTARGPEGERAGGGDEKTQASRDGDTGRAIGKP